jgi:soluble lytic murein transglycosylase
MSSMGIAAKFLPVLLLCAAPASAQMNYFSPAPLAGQDISRSFSDWRSLRQGGGYSFAQYASFLNFNPGWPAETTLRRNAERSMRQGENPGTVLAFYRIEKPKSGNGFMRYGEALQASGRSAEAVAAFKEAWASPDLGAYDASNLLARFAGFLTPEDHNRRVDALLFDKKPQTAASLVPYTSADRREAFAARLAMQSRYPDAEYRFRAASHRLSSDAGLMMDRLRYLRDGNNQQLARSLASQPHNFTHKPADPERWLEMLLILANGAAADRQWNTAYNIARQIDDVLPPGTNLALQPLGVRDDYTSLAWLAGRTALDRLNRPGNAMALFDRYSRGGKSLQVLTKGQYWAGRAALAARQPGQANFYLATAANYPELFYGQLALERLGRPVPAPRPAGTIPAMDPSRHAFSNNRLVRATRYAVSYGSTTERSIFTRALGEALKTSNERVLAMELSRQIGRPDIAVWVARGARNNGAAFYVRDAYPTHQARISPNIWSLAHGITRQESSFDRYAVSHAGARGLMQLMPGTAREQAGKLGVGYDPGRVTDPSYNIMLGSAYFQRMLNTWNGSVPLAVASYNAGPGNVRKWVNAYGDPRTGGTDVIGWIESIPFSETKGYVQRVIENTVVYDQVRGGSRSPGRLHVSEYLGKSYPG